MGECCEKLFPMGVISVDALTGTSTTGDVIKGTGNSMRRGREIRARYQSEYCKT